MRASEGGGDWVGWGSKGGRDLIEEDWWTTRDGGIETGREKKDMVDGDWFGTRSRMDGLANGKSCSWKRICQVAHKVFLRNQTCKVEGKETIDIRRP